MELQIHHLEQEAYSSVLRAFLAQSDSISWDQLELITHLRRELKVSDDEHKELYGRVKDDDIIQRIKEWRHGGGSQATTYSSSQPGRDQLLTSSVSASRKKQKTSHSGPSPAMGMKLSGLQAHSHLSAKQGMPLGTRGKKTKPGQPFHGISSAKTFEHLSKGPYARGRFTNKSFGAPKACEYGQASNDPLIGRKVFTRWPEDNSFYEAVITDYNPSEGRHALVYDINTVNEAWEWVDLKEISPEDVQWVGEDPGISRREGSAKQGLGIRKSTSCSDGIRERECTYVETRKELPSLNGTEKVVSDEIEIINTETLIKEVEKIFSASHPDPLEINRAKKMLQDHEKALVDAIMRLADASDGESGGEETLSHCRSADKGQDSKEIENSKNVGIRQNRNVDVQTETD